MTISRSHTAKRARRRSWVVTLAALGALAVAAAPGAAGAAVKAFAPGADAYVRADSRTKNFGRAKTLVVSPSARSYVRFGVNGLSGTVTRATLELSARTAAASGFSVRALARGSWSERAITHANAPRPGGAAVSSGAVRRGARLKIDVTRLVGGPGPLTLVLTARGRSALTLASREAGRAAAPRLVVATNSPPTCAAVSLATDEDVPGATGAACSDADGDALTYEIVSQATKGTASVVAGELRYQPNANANGADSFSYRARDASSASAPASVSVTVRPVNDAPVCQPLSLALDEDTTGTVAPACSDADGDALTYGIAAQGSKGRASIVGGSTVRYEPDPNQNGADSFAYHANDGHGFGPAATVTVTIRPVNDAPVCSNVPLSVVEDTPAERDPACTDADGDALTVEIVAQGLKGTASVAAGKLRYVPNANANGGDLFTYRARDASSASAPATVTVSIAAVNDAPTCETVALTTDEDVAGDAGPACSDVDGDALSFEIVAQGTKGTASVTPAGRLRYVPSANENGGDGFTYRARDGAAESAPATVTVTVRPVNDPPRANMDIYTVAEDTVLEFPAAELAANDLPGPANELDQKLTVTRVFATPDTRGRLDVHGGTVRYTPPADFHGADTLRYDVCDDGKTAGAPDPRCDSGVVSITVTPVNDAPEALPQNVTMNENTARTIVLVGDDADGDALTFTIETLPAHGSLFEGAAASGDPIAAEDLPHRLPADAVTYRPDPGYVGPDEFDFVVHDGTVASEAASVSITVEGVNAPPVCTEGPFTVAEDGELWDVVCTDEDGDDLQMVATLAPAHGSLDLFEDGSFNYVPEPDYNGPDSFTVRATDPEGASDTATVAIDVTPVNDAPTCEDTDLVTDEDVPGETAPVCTDVDDAAAALKYQIVSQGTKGTASVTTAGMLRYVPASGQTGADSFTYRASDGTAASAVATVAVTIDPAPNAPPVCEGLILFTSEDTAGSTVTDCWDPDDDELTFQIVTQGTKGTASVTSDDRLRYVPKPDENGTDTFTYRASDGQATSTAATIDVTIAEVNDPPIAADDFDETIPKGDTTGVVVQVLANDKKGPANESDQTLDVTPALVEEPKHGVANVGTSGADNNKIRYFPDEGYAGPDTFVYEVCDDGTTADEPAPKCDTARVSVTVVEVVQATVETDPVPSSGDAADDSAIWVHPTDPAQSVVIGTNKTGNTTGGLALYDLTGDQIAYYADGRMNNVDLRGGFPLAGGSVTLVAATNRTSRKIALYRFHETTRTLENVAAASVPNVGFDPYGGCMYRSPAGEFFFFITKDDPSSAGLVQQWRLAESATTPGQVEATLVRSFNVPGRTLSEGCVVDDELGFLYVAEEDVGIWKYDVEPFVDAPSQVDSTDLVSGVSRMDIEGLAIAYSTGGTGYLIASSQGNSSFTVFRREGDNDYVKSFRVDDLFDGVGALAIDGVSGSDGIEVTTAPLGAAFPHGVFVTQDDRNHTIDDETTANQNYKLVPLERILGVVPPPF